MARPKSNPSHLRIKRIVFHLTEGECLRLAHKAASVDMKLNAYARFVVLNHHSSAGSRTDNKPQSVCDPALVKQLYAIGHNINQITKRFHVTGRISPRIEQLAERIEALMDEALEQSNNGKGEA